MRRTQAFWAGRVAWTKRVNTRMLKGLAALARELVEVLRGRGGQDWDVHCDYGAWVTPSFGGLDGLRRVSWEWRRRGGPCLPELGVGRPLSPLPLALGWIWG